MYYLIHYIFIVNYEVMKRGGYVRTRMLIRLAAVQSLFQYNFHEKKEGLEEIFKSTVECYICPKFRLSEKVCKNIISDKFLKQITKGTIKHVKKIDKIISENLKEGYEFENLKEIIKICLRLGVFELMFAEDVPAKVVIDEYVSIVAGFYDKRYVKFVNAILDNIAKKVRG